MFTAVQILLVVVVLVLTALSVVIGVQVFKLVRQLRRLVDKLQLFLKKQDSLPKSFSSFADEGSLIEEEKSSRNSSSFVSVGFRPKTSSASSSRSFYRNGRNLS